MKRPAQLLLAALLGIAFQAGAAPQGLGPDHPSTVTTQHKQSSLEYSDRNRAEQWGLTEQEWHRYRHLMQGIRGSISPDTISPIEVLGIHAQSDSERRRHAERWAQMLRDDTEKILAFQQAVIEANVLLYGNQPLIDVSRLKRKEKKAALSPGDRLLFFTAMDCSACDAQLSALLSKSRLSAAGLDIFLLGTEGKDEVARNWAQAHNIPPEQVRQQTITINHDNGTLAQLSQGLGEPPYLMRQSALGTTPISIGDLW